MDAIIFDLDGTLANLSHRLHYIQGPHKNYDAFFDAMVGDAPIIPVVQLARMVKLYNGEDQASLVICSGRPDSHLRQTGVWLQNNFIPYDKLYMRKTGDYRADHIIKKEMLQQMREDGYDPFLVIEDRPSVVRMWREEGLICLQCAEWRELDVSE